VTRNKISGKSNQGCISKKKVHERMPAAQSLWEKKKTRQKAEKGNQSRGGNAESRRWRRTRKRGGGSPGGKRVAITKRGKKKRPQGTPFDLERGGVLRKKRCEALKKMPVL